MERFKVKVGELHPHDGLEMIEVGGCCSEHFSFSLGVSTRGVNGFTESSASIRGCALLQVNIADVFPPQLVFNM